MTNEQIKEICGLVMPFSKTDGCEPSHWTDVRQILEEAIEEAGFTPNLVSDADEVGIIQNWIIQNLYENPVVVCDVSGKNPNVMFELGLRVAFDKPTIIVKEDQTTYTFDTSPIEHISYPRDLRFSQIVEFKERLAEKIQATHKRSLADPNYTTFLKHFGEFTVAKLDKKEVSSQAYILEQLQNLSIGMQRLLTSPVTSKAPSKLSNTRFQDGDLNVCMLSITDSETTRIAEELKLLPSVKNVNIERRSGSHRHLVISLENPTESEIRKVGDVVAATGAKRNIRGNKDGRLVPIERLSRE